MQQNFFNAADFDAAEFFLTQQIFDAAESF